MAASSNFFARWASILVLFSGFAAAEHYTYTLVKHPHGCPTVSPVATLNSHTISASSAGPQATLFFSDSGAAAPQFVAPDHHGSQISFQTHNTSRIALQLPTNQSAFIDNAGVHLFTADCSKELHLPIPNLVSVITNQNMSRSRPLFLEPRSAAGPVFHARGATQTQTIPLDISFVDQCGVKITDHVASSTCHLTIPNAMHYETYQVFLNPIGGGEFAGACDVLSIAEAKAECRDTVKSVLDYPTKGFLGQLTNIGGDLRALGSIIRAGKIAASIGAAAKLIAKDAISDALIALLIYQQIIAAGGDELAAKAYCGFLYGSFLFSVDATLDTESYSGGNHIVNSQTATPITGVIATRTATISSATCMPTCGVYYESACGDRAKCTDSSCYCEGVDVGQGDRFCYRDNGCDIAANGPPCTGDSDCTWPGYRCITEATNCCGQNVCLYAADSSYCNTVSRRVF